MNSREGLSAKHKIRTEELKDRAKVVALLVHLWAISLLTLTFSSLIARNLTPQLSQILHSNLHEGNQDFFFFYELIWTILGICADITQHHKMSAHIFFQICSVWRLPYFSDHKVHWIIRRINWNKMEINWNRKVKLYSTSSCSLHSVPLIH